MGDVLPLRACPCLSSNEPEPWQTEPGIVLQLPWEPARTVVVDACIAPAIEELWRAGIITLGSCCGHGAVHPNVILAHASDGAGAIELLQHIDQRPWIVLGWVLSLLPAEPWRPAPSTKETQ